MLKKFSKKYRYQYENLYLTKQEVSEDPTRPMRANYIHRQALRYRFLEEYYEGKPMGALVELFIKGRFHDYLRDITKQNRYC